MPSLNNSEIHSSIQTHLKVFLELLLDRLLGYRIKKDEKESYALIIDGATLGYLTGGGKELQNEFCQVGLKCDAVLCCRMSPAQKAEVSILSTAFILDIR